MKNININNTSQIGIIGDVHTENILLEKALNFFETQNVEIIVCAGDIADGNGNLNKCCELLNKDNILTVKGNHDSWLFIFGDIDSIYSHISESSIDFLRSLPKTIDIKTKIGTILLCHGIGDDDMKLIMPDDGRYAIESNLPLLKILLEKKYKFMINGHSHCEMVKKVDELIIINAGTIQREYHPGILILDIDKKEVIFYKFNNKEELYEEKIIPVL